MVVTNAREGDMFVSPAVPLSAEEFIGLEYPFLSQQQVNTAAALYSGRGDRINQIKEVIAESEHAPIHQSIYTTNCLTGC